MDFTIDALLVILFSALLCASLACAALGFTSAFLVLCIAYWLPVIVLVFRARRH